MSNVARITKLNDAVTKLNATIEAATEKRDTITKELENIEALVNVGVGSKVSFYRGRAVKDKETGEVVTPRQYLTGVVSATKVEGEGTDEEKRLFKVEVGEGFESLTVILTEGEIDAVAVEADAE